MMNITAPKSVESNQAGPYKDIEKLVRKYVETEYRRPIADHTKAAFEEACQFVEKFYEGAGCGRNDREGDGRGGEGRDNAGKAQARAVILDSGCGTGESTLHIARRFPDIPVIGIDKSGERLTKAANPAQLKLLEGGIPANAFWIRGELLDFWRLALDAVKLGLWQIPYHANYYPNPWPKESEATRRFHLHPIFPTLMQLGEEIELRTNWEIYAQEFEIAAKIFSDIFPHSNRDFSNRNIERAEFVPENPETAFERKYHSVGQTLWKVTVKREMTEE